MNVKELEVALGLPRRNVRVLVDDLSECMDLYEEGEGHYPRFVVHEPWDVSLERVFQTAVEAVVRRRRGW